MPQLVLTKSKIGVERGRKSKKTTWLCPYQYHGLSYVHTQLCDISIIRGCDIFRASADDFPDEMHLAPIEF